MSGNPVPRKTGANNEVNRYGISVHAQPLGARSIAMFNEWQPGTTQDTRKPWILTTNASRGMHSIPVPEPYVHWMATRCRARQTENNEILPLEHAQRLYLGVVCLQEKVTLVWYDIRMVREKITILSIIIVERYGSRMF